MTVPRPAPAPAALLLPLLVAVAWMAAPLRLPAQQSAAGGGLEAAAIAAPAAGGPVADARGQVAAQFPAPPATPGVPPVDPPQRAGPLARRGPAAEPATRAVAARDLARGEVLTPADIARVPAPAEGVAAPALPASLIGWRTRRVIAAGEPLTPPAVSPPDLVRAGEEVQVLYQGRSVVLRVSGTAAGSAAMGERVLVRVDARRRLEGVVIGPALVQLDAEGR